MYDLLRGIRVLDISFAAPARLGVFLADVGADVIKVESLPDGDRIRLLPDPFQHLMWNRGKRSLLLDLKSPKGAALFLELAAKSDVVIDGLRSGALESWGLGFQAVRSVKPNIVYCTINGVGTSGPYTRLGTHGLGYDAFAGIIPIDRREDGSPRFGRWTNIGPIAGPLYAFAAVSSALVKAGRTGEGQYIEVAQLDASALWRGDEITRVINGAASAEAALKDAVRYQFYECSDGKYIQFQPFEWKFFQGFADAIGRPDLISLSTTKDRRPGAMDLEIGNEPLRKEIAAILITRPLREWIDFCIAHNIPAVPAYEDPRDMMTDPHFITRGNVRTTQNSELGTYHELTTPIKLAGQQFDVRSAPKAGEHTEELLGEILGASKQRIHDLAAAGVIGQYTGETSGQSS